MTDNTQELDELLERLMQYSYNYGSGNIPTSENPPLIIARQTKQAILDWRSKQVEAKLAHISEYAENVISIDKNGEFSMKAIPLSLVAAERNKLKGAEL